MELPWAMPQKHPTAFLSVQWGWYCPGTLPEELVSVFRGWGGPEQSQCDEDRRCLRDLLC